MRIHGSLRRSPDLFNAQLYQEIELTLKKKKKKTNEQNFELLMLSLIIRVTDKGY